MKWEKVAEGPNSITERLHAPGGWIVRSQSLDPATEATTASDSVFVPDPRHEWVLGSESFCACGRAASECDGSRAGCARRGR
ncbi:MAG: hypothetical protein Q8Q14_12275 [Gemmatimonadales bacterium]|nr:hypothetical protein [Gemmatimonadales bacterium]